MSKFFARKYLHLSGWILLCLIVGSLGSAITIPAIPTWYAGIQKSALNPPSFVFGPVWTMLYILMAIAAWMIAELKSSKDSRLALFLFFAQLGLNYLWSVLFFGKHQLLAAFLEIILLWLFILATIIKFYRLKPLAGLIMIPYLIWVSFASYLTYAVWVLNS